MRVVGRNVRRKEGRAKVTGAARYVDDVRMPGMLHGRTVRSPIACGELLAIKTDFEGPGFTSVSCRDIPGKNVVSLIADDQPCLVEREIRHAEEPVMLLAHEDREALLAARVDLECRLGAPVFDPLASPRSFKDILIEKGDVAKGFAQAALILEGGTARGSRSTSRSSRTASSRGLRTAGSRCSGRSSALTTSSARSSRCWRFQRKRSASCRPRPAADSAAKKNTLRCSRDTRRCSP